MRNALTFLLLVTTAAPAAAATEVIAALPASGRNISAVLVQGTRALLVQRLSRRLRVIDMDRPPTAAPPSPQVAVQIAQSLRAQVALVMDMDRLGTTTIVSVTLYDVPSGQVLRMATEQTVAGPEALPYMVDLLVQRLFPTAGPEKPPVKEGEPQRRTTVGARFGGMFAVTSPGGNQGMPSGGLFVLAELVSFMADVSLDFAGTEGYRLTRFGLGVYLPFSQETDSLSLGAAAGWCFQRFKGQGAWGASIAPAVGLARGRYDRLRLRLEASYFFDLFEERSPDRLIPGSGAGFRSHGPQLNVGLSF